MFESLDIRPRSSLLVLSTLLRNFTLMTLRERDELINHIVSKGYDLTSEIIGPMIKISYDWIIEAITSRYNNDELPMIPEILEDSDNDNMSMKIKSNLD